MQPMRPISAKSFRGIRITDNLLCHVFNRDESLRGSTALRAVAVVVEGVSAAVPLFPRPNLGKTSLAAKCEASGCDGL